MPDTCKFCTRLKNTIEIDAYHTEQARRNGRENVDRVSVKYIAAFAHKTYFDGEPSGQSMAVFDELNFCPLCAADLRPMLKNV